MYLVLTLIGLLTFLLYFYLRPRKSNFWEAYGVKQYDHSNLIDNLLIMFGKKSMGDPDESVYKEMGDEKFCGVEIMGTPHLLLKDLDIVKKILIKEFDSFPERRNFGLSDKQPILSKMLASLKGEEWKGVRSALRPTFTSGKIRRMMESFNLVSIEWVKHLKEEIERKGEGSSIDILVSRETAKHSVDVIARAVFGMNAGAIRDPNSIFFRMSENLLRFDWKFMFKAGIFMNFPKIADLVGLTLFNQESLDFFENFLVQGMKRRMEGLEERNDFLQLVAEARKGNMNEETEELSEFEKEAEIKLENDKSSKKSWLNDDMIAAAQMTLFFFNGFTQTSSLVGFVLYFMALHPEYQDKLREELEENLFKDGREDVDYDLMISLQFLEMCVCETLRKVAPAPRLDRLCMKDYEDKEFGFRVPKGTFVAIPIQAIHNDKKYYDHPDQFYPEHFSPDNKAKRNPHAFLAFGGGRRNCIGMRFAIIEAKAAISHVIHNFKVSVTENTPVPFKPSGMPVLPETLELRLTPI